MKTNYPEKISIFHSHHRSGKQSQTLHQRARDWLVALENGEQIDVGRQSNAFDKVSSCWLSNPMASVRTNLLEWIKSILAGRSQQVLVERQLSGPATVTPSVPHGSALGPVLVLLYTNDVPRMVAPVSRLFAGHTRCTSRPRRNRTAQSSKTTSTSFNRWRRIGICPSLQTNVR